jgi:signal transduction histidine kinase
MTDTRIADMISKIAHELRSPLTSVKGFSSMLLTRWDRFTDEQRFQFVETIHADAERMGRIVSEVLDLARLEAGRLELHREIVQVADVARKAAARLGELPGAERIEYKIDDGLTAWADPERLEAILGQLLENAAKYSDEGAVTVSARREDGGVGISVHDHGIGIDPDFLPHVFSGPAPKDTRHKTPSGAGLGLYLSKGLTEAHGGRIAVDSRVAEGSVFRVWLPGGPESDA